MGIKTYRPITPGLRHRTGNRFDELSGDAPYKPLLLPLAKSGGRDSRGHLSMRNRGGGHKQMYRVVDFKRDKIGIPGTVETVEYDPNRSSFISLVKYRDGERRYIIYPVGLQVGQEVVSTDRQADILPGNAMPLRFIPLGTVIHNIELRKDKGGQVAKSAGAGAQILAKEGDYLDHSNISVGKAGRSRWKGIRPHVRGTAMNPIDHPHGGGEGKAKGGRHPVSPEGIPTKGFKTRQNKRTQSFIVRRRSK
jgi:large subunit ribosomal protein L2